MINSFITFLIYANEKDLIDLFTKAVVTSGNLAVLEKVRYTLTVAEEDCKETIDGDNR
jgi:hypothetical protein